MDQSKSKTTAADFFIYLGIIIGLYVSTFNLISLSFNLINKWLPDVGVYNDYSIDEARVALAALIIFFPVFIYLSRISTKAVTITPEKKDLWVRRWFFFLTLFLTGLAIAIDLSTLVYRFIGGEDLTLRFVLKVLVVFITALSIFRFYLYELRRDVTLPTPNRKYMSFVACFVMFILIVAGIMAIGSPSEQRNVRFDQQRINDLSSIQSSVTEYYRANDNVLPKDLITLSQSTYNYGLNMKDPETQVNYEYSIISKNQYKICANFATDNTKQRPTDMSYPTSEIWKHGIGKVCFDRIAGEIPVVPKIL